MKRTSAYGGALALSALLATTSPTLASEQTDFLTKAAATAEHMKSDPAFGPARKMIDNARAVLIVPHLVKGGFIFGAEGGDGVLLGKSPAGWSQPAFYSMGSASFGLQAGLERAEIVMLVMNDKALSALQSTDFKVGANAGLTVVNLSGGVEAATNLNGDILVWTSASGAYGGLTLNGSVIKPKDDWNKKFYGRPVTVPEILAGSVQNADSNTLRSELAAINNNRG